MVLIVLCTPTDRRAPIALETDILGGAAGVAAAVTAARQGLRVALLERYGFCGGGAVAGLSGTICGMYEASNDPNARPNQIVHGFLDEFVQHLSERGGLTPPVRYGKTFTRVHDPLVWREAADLLLRDAVLLHTVVTEALVEGSERIEGIVAYTKEGPLSVRARVTIDASGDADVVASMQLDRPG
jgi:flavin-dependent dehydrogenase